MTGDVSRQNSCLMFKGSPIDAVPYSIRMETQYQGTLMLEAADSSEMSVCMCVTSHPRTQFSLDNTCLWYAALYVS